MIRLIEWHWKSVGIALETHYLASSWTEAVKHHYLHLTWPRRGSCRNKRVRRPWKKGDRGLPRHTGKGCKLQDPAPKGSWVCWELCTFRLQYPEGLLRESVNNSSTTCQVYCSAGILCLLDRASRRNSLEAPSARWSPSVLNQGGPAGDFSDQGQPPLQLL